MTHYADTILVFRDGTIVERGPHADLISGDTLYRRIYEGHWKRDLTRAQLSISANI